MLAGVPVFPVRFGDFLAALAASSYVCCALTPVIPGVSFLGYEWRELADCGQEVNSELSRMRGAK